MWLRWVGFAKPRKICPSCRKTVDRMDIDYTLEIGKNYE